MSAITTEKTISTNRQQLRRQAVESIIKKHSERVFGHSEASLREIRLESVKRRFESAFANS